MDSGVVSGGRSAVAAAAAAAAATAAAAAAAAAAASTGSKAGSENAPAMDGSNSSGRSTPSGGDQPHNKLFVGGLSWQTSADKLREYFGQYGTIIDVQVLKDPLTQVHPSLMHDFFLFFGGGAIGAPPCGRWMNHRPGSHWNCDIYEKPVALFYIFLTFFGGGGGGKSIAARLNLIGLNLIELAGVDAPVKSRERERDQC